jgi:DNA adenine methylase
VIPQRPFLKWAGAKTRLVAAIRTAAPADARRLIEPFTGSGAVALNLGYPRALLADTNADLIDVYRELKRSGENFISACEKFFTPRHNSAKTYYKLRDEFNASTDRRRKAALFVYLNRHGYNGLCRYNSRGGYNVPFGRYDAPYFPRKEMENVRRLLRRCTLRRADFRAIVAAAGDGDFVYCDPPYAPASATANFTSYARGGFGSLDQADLLAACLAARRRGACIAISNHDTLDTRRLYARADEIISLSVARHISRDGRNRTRAKELLVIYRPVA